MQKTSTFTMPGQGGLCPPSDFDGKSRSTERTTAFIADAELTPVSEQLSIYQIFVRNYTEEGTFLAAIPRLGEVRELGCSWVYLTPIHPIGSKERKGSLGSPYAISDYRTINPELGTLEDFREFAEAVHKLGLKLMIDVVYNHTAPDSLLAVSHPEWFMHAPDGSLSRKCGDWSDVVDFDYYAPASRPALWDELIDILDYWRGVGADGFRCDVASLVPVEFWKAARRRINRYNPETGQEERPTLWLAESVHPSFVAQLRSHGYKAWSDPELHAAFDLSYDYDGFEILEKVWTGEKSITRYLEHIPLQRSLFPASARKIRYLENHDQKRAAWRFSERLRLESWTLFYQFLPGCTFVYMGQEAAISYYPSLFEKSTVPWHEADKDFYRFFKRCFDLTLSIKAEPAELSFSILSEGLVLLSRKSSRKTYYALCNLESRRGFVELPFPIRGKELFTGKSVALSGKTAIPESCMLIEADTE